MLYFGVGSLNLLGFESRVPQNLMGDRNFHHFWMNQTSYLFSGWEGAKELRVSIFPIQWGAKELLRASQAHDRYCFWNKHTYVCMYIYIYTSVSISICNMHLHLHMYIKIYPSRKTKKSPVSPARQAGQDHTRLIQSLRSDLEVQRVGGTPKSSSH